MGRRIDVDPLICSPGHCEYDGHTVHKLILGRLTADWLDPRESVHGSAVTSSLTGRHVTSRPRDRFSRYSNWLDTFPTGLVCSWHSRKLVLPFVYVEMTDSSTDKNVPSLPSHIRKHASRQLRSYSKEICGYFQTSLPIPATCRHDSVSVLIQQRRNELGWNSMHVRIL